MEETINWLDSGIVCAARQERRKEGMPPGMFGSLKIRNMLAFSFSLSHQLLSLTVY